ncbi:MAG TPA: hypothetical protein VLA74_07280 [Nitrososphaeraceae archaeon]|nr:hypothetical protein [Nitrososphaeraceae archaeon]
MEKLSLTSSPSAKPSVLSEGDEFYINAGPKGRRYHEKIVKPGRNPGKEGSNSGSLEVHFSRIIK